MLLLKEIRKENHLTQAELADKLKISRSTYSLWEIETEIIPIKHLINLSDFYNISINAFFDFNHNTSYKKSKAINMEITSSRLKEFRKENKLTQSELAKILNTVQPVIANYENGKHLIATPFLYAICKKYNISADYLLGRVDKPKYLNKD